MERKKFIKGFLQGILVTVLWEQPESRRTM